MAVERKRFCTELELGGLENLCVCVTDGVFQSLEGKVETCFRARYKFYPSDRKLVERELYQYPN
jgi:hypothetical protein